jgi:hypothetical protein
MSLFTPQAGTATRLRVESNARYAEARLSLIIYFLKTIPENRKSLSHEYPTGCEDSAESNRDGTGLFTESSTAKRTHALLGHEKTG